MARPSPMPPTAGSAAPSLMRGCCRGESACQSSWLMLAHRPSDIHSIRPVFSNTTRTSGHKLFSGSNTTTHTHGEKEIGGKRDDTQTLGLQRWQDNWAWNHNHPSQEHKPSFRNWSGNAELSPPSLFRVLSLTNLGISHFPGQHCEMFSISISGFIRYKSKHNVHPCSTSTATLRLSAPTAALSFHFNVMPVTSQHLFSLTLQTQKETRQKGFSRASPSYETAFTIAVGLLLS